MTRRTWWLLALLIGALALGASANSLSNGFAYDDVYVIAKQPRMHSFFGWWREFGKTYWLTDGGGPGDGYRPLTILSFKAQWIAGNGSPMPFHLVNIVVHIVTAIAVFWLACAVLPLAVAWIAAALYAVHPVHVEAIANIVGQSELVVALLLTIAAALYLRGRAVGPLSASRWTAIGALYAVALLFKEHAITLIALLPLAELTVVTDRGPMRARLARMRLPLLALALVALTYMWARSRVVIGVAGFQPYVVFEALHLSTRDRIFTMIGASTEWVRLLLWPARLATEYAPPYVDVAQGFGVAQIPGLLLLLGILGLAVATWRRSPATAFGIGWIVVTLLPASNFVVPAGFIVAERTLLLPSVGAMIAVGSAVPWIYAQIEHRRAAQYACSVAVLLLLALGLARSYTRNPVWKDSGTLFRQAVKDTPESYRAHFMLGTWLFEHGRKREAEEHMMQAYRLFPLDPLMAIGLAEQYRAAGMCEPAIAKYRLYFALNPDARRGHLGYALCMLLTYHPEESRAAALQYLRVGGKLSDAREMIVAANALRDTMAARAARGEPIGAPTAQPAGVPAPK